jgi:hypothetical protein
MVVFDVLFFIAGNELLKTMIIWTLDALMDFSHMLEQLILP